MLGQTDLSVMSIGNLMCLIAAFSKTCFFLSSVLSDSGNTPFQVSPTSPGTVQPYAGTEFDKIACLPWVLPISCSFRFLPPLLKRSGCLPGRNLGQAVGGGANRAPRTTGHRWLGLGNRPSYHATSQHLLFDVFFLGGLQSFIISCLKDPIS